MHQTFPKPTPRRIVKARKDRHEAAVKKSVRAQTVERDGYCVFTTRLKVQLVGPCGGPSEWAHVETHRRYRTRGQKPEARHTTTGSCQMCRTHHQAYDAHWFGLKMLSTAGMDGKFAVTVKAPQL